LAQALQAGPAVLVTVAEVEGSGPREVGAWMAVTGSACIGTIGGGALEFDAMAKARAMLAGEGATGAMPTATQRVALGPSLGQCCGGVVHLRYETLTSADAARLTERLRPADTDGLNVALFGGGHVGCAIVELLIRLPGRVQWIDSRDEVFPPELLMGTVEAEHSEPVHSAVASLRPGASVLIMSFSHAEDLDVLAACLLRQRKKGDLPFIGLIGSKSKWASFRSRLRERGFSDGELSWVTSPIGLPGISGKQPEVIAVAVAAQLLLAHACLPISQRVGAGQTPVT
jgi:xanthine dehydrogenase accessory factor